jgi:ABC-type glycerol-3-phosphate transport system permease component
MRQLKKGFFYFFTFLLFGLISFPIFWAILCSFKTFEEMMSVPLKIIPSTLTLSHYQAIWETTQIPLFFGNSLIVATGASVLTVIVAGFAAYSLTRFPFPGISTIARSILFCYMLPPVLLSIPFFLMLNTTHMLNTRLGLMFCHTALSLPFVMWLFWGFFRTIPTAIEEAARVDGAGRMQILFGIFFPLAMPGIIAGFIFSFIVSWSDYLFSSVIATNERINTLPIAIANLASRDFISWEVILPAMGVATMPVLFIMVVFQKYLIQGFSTPVVKG